MTVSSSIASPTVFSKIIRSIWEWIKKIPPVIPVFIVIYIAMGFIGHSYQTLPGFLRFLRQSSPFAILAIGEMMVLITGGFDLSIGAIVTFVVLGSSLLLNNDPANAYPAILFMLGFGVVVGVLNGVIVSYLKVPSFITTLGMMLLVRGGANYWVGGSAQGYLTDNWRYFGNGNIENVPGIGRVPVSFFILLGVGLIAWFLFHRTNFGKLVLAVGDNVRASQLSGVRVSLVRILAFILSSVCAVVAAILVGGIGGVNVTVGDGYELQTIASCVVGGIMLGGGKGSVTMAIFGAFTMQAIFNLLNLLGLPKPYTDVVQGLIILIAVTYAAFRTTTKR
jgi:ribose transport system permease protein